VQKSQKNENFKNGTKYDFLWSKITVSDIISTKIAKVSGSPGVEFGPETR
jgi:hypothetical protein